MQELITNEGVCLNKKILSEYYEAVGDAMCCDTFPMKVFAERYPLAYKHLSAVHRKRATIKRSIEAMREITEDLYFGTLTYNKTKDANKITTKRKEAFNILNALFEYVVLVEEFGPKTECRSWADFNLQDFSGLDSDADVDELIKEHLKSVRVIGFNLTSLADGGSFKIVAIGKYSDGLAEYSEHLFQKGIYGLDYSRIVDETLYDGRDGKTYKITEINGQVWMAENLNYEVDNSFCYIKVESNCETFGRLYTWNAAMNGSSAAETRGVCPLGWHVPSKDEWEKLGKFVVLDNKSVGGKSGIDFDNDKSPLRAESFWKSQYAGSDKYGFSILPGGIFYRDNYDKLGEGAYFWTSKCDLSTGTSTSYSPYAVAFYEDEDFEFVNEDLESIIAFSLRCIKDSD